MTLPEVRYYESHITIEPILEENKLAEVKQITSDMGFQVAELLLQRRKEDTPERSAKDSFCTGRDKSYEVLKHRMHVVSQDLRAKGYKVWRCKIEAVIYDERTPK